MVQKVTDELNINRCYRIDTQFLVCLNDIFKKYNSEGQISVTAVCGKVKFNFSSINEFLDSESTFTSKIEKMEIKAKFPTQNRYSYNEVSVNFSDEAKASLLDERITFDFTDPNGYLVIKNQIETLLKNYELSYSFFSRTKLVPWLSALFLASITIYTNEKNIIFPSIIQDIILYGCVSGMVLPFLPIVVKLKRHLFPSHEFTFGVNKISIEKAKNHRNFLGTSLIVAFVVGILVNFVSSFLF